MEWNQTKILITYDKVLYKNYIEQYENNQITSLKKQVNIRAIKNMMTNIQHSLININTLHQDVSHIINNIIQILSNILLDKLVIDIIIEMDYEWINVIYLLKVSNLEINEVKKHIIKTIYELNKLMNSDNGGIFEKIYDIESAYDIFIEEEM